MSAEPPLAPTPAVLPGQTPPPKPQPPGRADRVSMRSLWRNLEFRAMAIAQFFSIAGDQLARVALSVLIFDRTGSALEAATAYALTYVPAALGGPLLSGLADRRPRRSVMIMADLIQAPLIALLAIPSIPIPLALVLLSAAGLFDAPFTAARSALLPDVLPGERFPAGLAFSQMVVQVAQIGGFGLAGLLLIALSPAALLLLDAATFVLSAILVASRVRSRPAAVTATEPHRKRWWSHALSDLRLSVDLVLGNADLRSLAVLAWASITFAIGFEGLCAPLARVTHSHNWAVGVLLAAQPTGTVLGAMFVTRVPAASRPRTMQVMAVLSVAPLVVALTRPQLGVMVAIGVAAGVGIAFNVIASTTFVARVSPQVRGRALGLVGTGMLVGQGLGILAAGSIATAIDPRLTVGWMGVLGCLAVGAALIDGARGRRENGHG